MFLFNRHLPVFVRRKNEPFGAGSCGDRRRHRGVEGDQGAEGVAGEERMESEVEIGIEDFCRRESN